MKLCYALLLFALILSGCAEDITGGSGEQIKIALYNGEGAVQMEVTALENMFEWMGYEVTKVNSNLVLGDGISRYDIVVFPGGSPSQYASDLGESGLQKIREYIEGGGGYIGICGGAMLACESASWNGIPMELDFLGIFDGKASGPADAGTPGYWTMEKFDLIMSHPINQGLPDSMYVLYNNNPYFLPDDPSCRVALFSESGQCGFAGCDHGQGRVFVMGPMPQFEEDSDRDGVDVFDILDDRGSDWPFMQNVSSWILKDIE